MSYCSCEDNIWHNVFDVIATKCLTQTLILNFILTLTLKPSGNPKTVLWCCVCFASIFVMILSLFCHFSPFRYVFFCLWDHFVFTFGHFLSFCGLLVSFYSALWRTKQKKLTLTSYKGSDSEAPDLLGPWACKCFHHFIGHYNDLH